MNKSKILSTLLYIIGGALFAAGFEALTGSGARYPWVLAVAYWFATIVCLASGYELKKKATDS